MLSESVRFDDRSRTSLSDQPIPLGGAPRALRTAAESSGLDPVAELYNEAITYASEGHLRLAKERLQVLLPMSPDDGEARLLLAKVLVAGQRWQEALSTLDEAASCGQEVPLSLRRAVEDHIRAEEASKEEHRAASLAREQGEIRALRQEARRLRSENAQLLGRCTDLKREANKWAWTTAGVSGLSLLFMIGALLFGGGSDSPEVAPSIAPEAAIEAPAEDGSLALASEAEGAPVQGDVSTRAATRLANAPALADTELAVQVIDGTAVLSGKVLAAHQLKLAQRNLLRMKSVKKVDTSKIVILARSQGTTHVVRSGDTLSHLSVRYYGEPGRTKNILRANKRTLRGRASLTIGQELVIPAID